MEHTVSVTPPRVPGPVEVRADRPVNRLASASTVFGAIGMLLPSTGIIAIVLGVLGLLRIKRGGDVERGRGLAVCGIVLGAMSMVVAVGIAGFSYFSYWTLKQNTPILHATSLSRVHLAMRTYMRQTGQYPTHVAQLVIDPNASAPAVIFSPEPFGGAPPVGTVMVGNYDFANYGGQPEDDAAVTAALATIDMTTPTYQFGQWQFARLPRSTLDRDVVFAWYRSPGSANAVVLTDDGNTRLVSPRRWAELWVADAAARTKHGLSALGDSPPFP